MRPTRRGVLAGLAVAATGALAPAPRARADLAGPIPVRLRTYPVPHLGSRAPVDGLYGRLRYRGGLELQASDAAFGGLSGLAMPDDGARLLAVSDHGHWFDAAVLRDAAGVISGIGEATLAPLHGPDGGLLWRQGYWDAEALTVDEDEIHVAIEVEQAVFRYARADGVRGRGETLVLPEAARTALDAWRGNRGLEGLTRLAPPSPLAGALVGVSERSRPGDDAPTQGVVLTGPQAGSTFEVARSGGFDVTDLETLPDGDLLVLERRFTLLDGVSARIRRVAAGTIAPGATLDGPILFEADWTDAIDNMEGLSAHRGVDGETVLTLVSDDNYSLLQRTLLLEFTLVED